MLVISNNTYLVAQTFKRTRVRIFPTFQQQKYSYSSKTTAPISQGFRLQLRYVKKSILPKQKKIHIVSECFRKIRKLCLIFFYFSADRKVKFVNILHRFQEIVQLNLVFKSLAMCH